MERFKVVPSTRFGRDTNKQTINKKDNVAKKDKIQPEEAGGQDENPKVSGK